MSGFHYVADPMMEAFLDDEIASEVSKFLTSARLWQPGMLVEQSDGWKYRIDKVDAVSRLPFCSMHGLYAWGSEPLPSDATACLSDWQTIGGLLTTVQMIIGGPVSLAYLDETRQWRAWLGTWLAARENAEFAVGGQAGIAVAKLVLSLFDGFRCGTGEYLDSISDRRKASDGWKDVRSDAPEGEEVV